METYHSQQGLPSYGGWNEMQEGQLLYATPATSRPVHAAPLHFSLSPIPTYPPIRTSPRKAIHPPERFDPTGYTGLAPPATRMSPAKPENTGLKRPADTGKSKHVLKRVKKEADTESIVSERYTDEQVTAMLCWISDIDHPKRVEKYLRNSRAFFRQMSAEVFKNKRSAESLKGKFMRLLKVYREIIALEKHTGGGDGDQEAQESGEMTLEMYEDRIMEARAQGRAVGSLTAAVVQQWHELRWYEMLLQALGVKKNYHRDQPAASNTPLSPPVGSDIEVLSSDSDVSERTEPEAELLGKKKRSSQHSYARGVPEPKFKNKRVQRGMGGSTSSNALVEFMSAQAAFLERKGEDDKARLELQRQREQREEERDRLLLAQSLIKDESTDPDIRAQAKALLLRKLQF